MGNRIRELRKAKGITMKQLGEVLGVAESTISHYENGRRQLDTETLLRLGEYFGVTVGYLLCAEDTKNAPTISGECDESNLRAAFFNGYADDLTESEKAAIWEDAQEYMRYKVMQLKNKKG